ncbi:hypothetical protein [Caproicibacterium lactatifermentans]|jgi:glycosyltransferase involved in cell wall biosynthesis|uniref:Glycosyl transferase family 1 domain-containing protein n=1 Tax=Caproicibacterium lactatifermentans TaxID=2666138 RepID=A0A859DQG6_9FIRM|nr:hypothetical protein [Caproicibacterium lactatifermentans]ARP50331.1 hypothetical protein B6259_05245 [Ruminococcaceae bacterium CPB6]QKN23946.1 hypothetical protein GJQ69_05290 [Caproicibacterium lactatifermentans]QKO30982.1 hypothetical protein GKP14_08255 [Caproicibacterium lactatifermentans]
MKKLMILLDHNPAEEGALPFLLPELAAEQQRFSVSLFSSSRMDGLDLCGLPISSFCQKKRGNRLLYFLPNRTKTIYRRLLKENNTSGSQKQSEEDIRQFLFQSEMLRRWLEKKGTFSSWENCVYYTYWYGIGAMALVLEKLRFPNLKIATRVQESDFAMANCFFQQRMFPYLNLIAFSFRGSRDIFCQERNIKKRGNIKISYMGVPDRGLNPPGKKGTPLQLLSEDYTENAELHLQKIAQALASIDFPIHWCHCGLDADILEQQEKTCRSFLSDTDNVVWKTKCFHSGEERSAYFQTHSIDLYLTFPQNEKQAILVIEACSYGIPTIAASTLNFITEIINPGIGYLLPAKPESQQIAQVLQDYHRASFTMQASLRLNARQIWFNSFNSKKNDEKFAKALFSL